ncbi:uncharacterized protein FA14DRAFT_190639 [Meira miltonrushii]|uniref:G-patch domain-containing protein n=1 Tax=Meira miltonrushii TaxID=1280837 RepID=A0A316VBY8_9BASI|nr:uncharacterized protein FA14DRAFT_190639 [Meira miltonrushii]PWN33491.1 hypothetical protein FA14DRAFT_190639 [Meira miltonrushii]
MPLNATTYLERHGWRGKGVPLDGESGRGLKKPLALPMKRNLKGVGKERDRAVEWWDCLFEAGAKKLQTAPAVTSKETVLEDGTVVLKPNLATSSSISLASLAKREHARKLLMSGFVRGRPNEAYEQQVKDLEKTLAEQDRERLAAKEKLAQKADLINGQNEKKTKHLEKAKRKEEKKLAKKMLKEQGEKSNEEKDAKKKRKREEKAAIKDVSQTKSDKGSAEYEDRAEKRRRKEEKRRQKDEKKQKKESREKSSDKADKASLKADKESKKRKRSSKD